MRFDKPASILKSSNESPGTALIGGDDFLSRINSVIANARELIKAVQELREMKETVQDKEPPGNPSNQPAPMAKFLQLMIAKGYGDMPIGELLEKVKPFTIKQLLNLAGSMKEDVRSKQ